MEDPATEYEHRMAEEIAGPPDRRVQRVTRRLAVLYVELAGSLEADMPPERQIEYKLRATEIIYQARSHTQRRVLRAARQAWRHGVKSTNPQHGLVRLKSPPLPPDVLQAIRGLDRAVGRDVADAAYLMKSIRVRNWRDVMTVVGKANQAPNRIERVVRWSANRAYNHGVATVADRLGQMRVWVPERDACLHCLGYAGAVAQPGGAYAPGLSFYIPADPSRILKTPTAVYGPPLHPNCRCREQPWSGTEDEYTGPDYPQVLQREAERTVLLGQAMASEPARLRAADALLRYATLAPKSIRDRARAAVKTGSFG